MLEKGTLYVCATPIGNLADITLRVLDTLRGADLIAAEDTRHSRKLLDHYEIHTPMVSYHEHNEKKRSAELLEQLEAGQTVALISDAGMPGISDPGWEIIQACQREGVPVDVLPGPNAGLTALVLSGMPADGFAFCGFLPAVAGKRQKKLSEVEQIPFTLIFYEAPHRLISTLQDMLSVLGNREGAVVREISKIHQSVKRGKLAALLEEYTETPPKGECCILVAPGEKEIKSGGAEDWVKAVEEEMSRGETRQDALKRVAKEFNVSKRDIYQVMFKKGGQK